MKFRVSPIYTLGMAKETVLGRPEKPQVQKCQHYEIMSKDSKLCLIQVIMWFHRD